MENKIVSVKLNQDVILPLSTIPKGTEGRFIYSSYYFQGSGSPTILNYSKTDIINNPEWFEVKYEQGYFEVKESEGNMALYGDGDIQPDLLQSLDFSLRGNYGTKENLKAKDKRDVVLNYFAKLAEYLNGLKGWEFEDGFKYQALIVYNNSTRIAFAGFNTLFPVTKFSPDLTINDIQQHAKPEMIEAYIEVCKNQIY